MTAHGDQLKDIGWYEATLPGEERKKRGHFSTPPLLVGQILDACGYTASADIGAVRVLDPACGSGNFLTEAARRLLLFGAKRSLSREEQGSLVQRNVWGFDPDPVSCFLAEMQLRAVIDTSNTYPDDVMLHIHQGDALTLPWEPCIDLLVANPPYLAAKNNDLSGYILAQRRGQMDSYLLFLHLAFQAVRPLGWIGLILPDPVLARVNAAQERIRLLEAFTLHHLWHFSEVFSAEVGAAVIIAQKCTPRTLHQITWVRDRWRRSSVPNEEAHNAGQAKLSARSRPNDTYPAQSLHSTVDQALLLRQPHAELRYLLSEAHGAKIERIRARLHEITNERHRFAPLGDFLFIHRGEELGKGSSLLTSISSSQEVALHAGNNDSEACSSAKFPVGENEHQERLPVVRGGIDIRPYGTPLADWGIARKEVKKPLERYLAPKLLVVKSTNRLYAALDVRGHVVLQTLYVLRLRDNAAEKDALYFFLALLNSRLLRNYVYTLHTAYKWVQPQIEQGVLTCLPVPLVEEESRQDIIERAKFLVQACGEGGPVVEWNEYIRSLYEEQESAICALYDSLMF